MNPRKTKLIRKKIGGVFYRFKRVTPLVIHKGLTFYPGDTFFYKEHKLNGMPIPGLTYYRVTDISKKDKSGNILFHVVEERKKRPNILKPSIAQRNFAMSEKNAWKFFIREEKYNATKQRK